MYKFLSPIAVASLLVLSACASGDKKEEQPQQAQAQAPAQPAEAPELGVAKSTPGELSRTVTSTIPTVKVESYKGDLNRMDQTNFEVMGIPPEVAQSIVNYRTAHGGRFSALEQLKEVPGMDSELYSRLRTKVGIAGETRTEMAEQ